MAYVDFYAGYNRRAEYASGRESQYYDDDRPAFLLEDEVEDSDDDIELPFFVSMPAGCGRSTASAPPQRPPVLDKTVKDLRGVRSDHGLLSSHCVQMLPQSNDGLRSGFGGAAGAPHGGGASGAMSPLPPAPPVHRGPPLCAPHGPQSSPVGFAAMPLKPMPELPHYGVGQPSFQFQPCRPPYQMPAPTPVPAPTRGLEVPTLLPPRVTAPPQRDVPCGFKDSSAYLASPVAGELLNSDDEDVAEAGHFLELAQAAAVQGRGRRTKRQADASCMHGLAPCLVSC